MIEVSIVIPYKMNDGELSVWMQRRKTQDELHQLWEFPGGKREAREQKRETAIREVLEETGVSIPISKIEYFYTTHVHYIKGGEVELNCYCYQDEKKSFEPDNWMKLKQFQDDRTPVPPINREIVKQLLEYLKVKKISV